MLKPHKLILHFFVMSSVVGLGISYSKLYLFHIALSLISVEKTVKFLLGKAKIITLKSKFHYMLLLMPAWYFATFAWSFSISYSALYLFYLVCGASISLVIVYNSKKLENQKSIFITLSIFFIVEILVGLLESSGSFRWPTSPFSEYSAYFGRSEKDIDISTFSDIGASYLRTSPTGFHGNPNNFATSLSMIFPFFLFARSTWVKFIASTLTLFLILATGSKSNMIAVMIMMILSSFYSPKRTLKAFAFALALIASYPVMLYGLEVLASTIQYRQLDELLNLVGSLDEFLFKHNDDGDSSQTRRQLISNGLEALFQTGGLGVGGGASKFVQEQFGGEVARVANMHNFWIEILVEGGVFFASAFFAWYGLLMLSLLKIAKAIRATSAEKQAVKYYASSVSLSMIGFLFSSNSPSTCIYLFPLWIMLGFAVATLNNYREMKSCKGVDTC